MVGQREQDDSEESEEELQVLTAEDILKERTRVSKIVKKGVGYNFSGGTGWNPSTYQQSKEKKHKQIIRIVRTVMALVDACLDDSAEYDDVQILSIKDEKKIR